MLDGVRHPIPAEAFLPITSKSEVPTNPTDSANYIYEWVTVAVTNYEENLKLWSVTTLDGFQRMFNIPRISLMFKAEDPQNFANRIKAAIDLRNEVESRIR